MYAKLIKAAIALTLSAAVLTTLGCKKDPATPAAAAPPAQVAQAARAPGEARVVKLTVTTKGYEPSPITLKKDEPVKLLITRTTEETCANEIVIDEHAVNTPLPLNQEVAVTFTPNKTGELKYGCGMDKMVSGVFKIE